MTDDQRRRDKKRGRSNGETLCDVANGTTGDNLECDSDVMSTSTATTVNKKKLTNKIRDRSMKSLGVIAAQDNGDAGALYDFEDDIESESVCSSPDTDEHEDEQEVENDWQDEDGEKDGTQDEGSRVWLPSNQITKGEGLEVDPKAYNMLHHFELGWSCLSLDIIRDDMGMERCTYPHSLFLVAGSQADTNQNNRIYVVKLSSMYKTNRDADAGESDMSHSSSSDDEKNDKASNDESSDDDYCCEPPAFRYAEMHHDGTVNRIRSCPQQPHLIVTWSERGFVAVWDVSTAIESASKDKVIIGKKDVSVNKYKTTAHGGEEGFALDWNTGVVGRFLSGGKDRKIMHHEYVGGSWSLVSQFDGHKGYVEDVQWQRNMSGCYDVFASCSTDGSIRLWDTRVGRTCVSTMASGHVGDVNVCSWSPTNADLLLSGGDDGIVCCWDTRQAESPTALVASIRFHTQPISAVDWHPTDSTQFAASSLDDSVSIWDLSVEAEDTAASKQGIPDQLMFLHSGQHHISEFKWHPQIPGVIVTTAEDGFHVFKAENM